MSARVFLLSEKLVRKRLSTRGKAKPPDLRTAQQRSDEEAIETLYADYLGGRWQDTYRSALADALWRQAWLEDRARFGLRDDSEWSEREFYQELATAPRGRAIAEANSAVRDRQPRPRRTVVDERLAYYDSLT
jgi:hypothetical protein